MVKLLKIWFGIFLHIFIRIYVHLLFLYLQLSLFFLVVGCLQPITVVVTHIVAYGPHLRSPFQTFGPLDLPKSGLRFSMILIPRGPFSECKHHVPFPKHTYIKNAIWKASMQAAQKKLLVDWKKLVHFLAWKFIGTRNANFCNSVTRKMRGNRLCGWAFETKYASAFGIKMNKR